MQNRIVYTWLTLLTLLTGVFGYHEHARVSQATSHVTFAAAAIPPSATFTNMTATGTAQGATLIGTGLASTSEDRVITYNHLTGQLQNTSQPVAAYFGDGSDGAATFDGVATPAGTTRNSGTSYTANRDLYYTSIAGSTGVDVNMNGYRVFCTGTATLTGTFQFENSGLAGGNGAGGVATGGAGGQANTIGGQQNSGGNAAAGAASVSNSFGGSGGNGGGAGAGAGGGTSTPSTTSSGAVVAPRQIPDAVTGYVNINTGVGTSFRTLLGGGGGGGGNNSSSNGGAGGGGGGVILCAFFILEGGGGCNAKGGNGGNASGGSGPGGGGGGGMSIIITRYSSAFVGTQNVNGGSAGTGGTGAAVAGSTGTPFFING